MDREAVVMTRDDLLMLAITRESKAIVEEFDRHEECRGAAKRRRPPLPRSEFDQCVAEANVKLGEELANALLMRAAGRFGWPIPAKHRARVAALLGFALLPTDEEKAVAG
jgi:hypothetical protein